MREIKAVIQPQRLSRLRSAFRRMQGFPGMTVVHAEGCSYHDGPESHDDVWSELTEFSPKVRIEIIAPEEKVVEILGIIHEICHTGQKGDGIAWVTDVGAFRQLRYEPI
jgi:nitrogen regulatory protein P-II 1